MVRQNPIPGDEANLRAFCEKLCSDANDLRRIAGLNIMRAAHIADTAGDTKVAQMLIDEASVMLSVATQVEELFRTEEHGDQ